MTIVIYGIECLKSGMTYVGHSTDPRRRWRIHRLLLKRGVHHVADMLADWRTFGESGFAVRVLEALPYGVAPQVARAAELRWRAHFAQLGLLYNVPRCPMCGRPHDLNSGEIVGLDPSGEKQPQFRGSAETARRRQ
jgi:GIY-YIG catalytic domain